MLCGQASKPGGGLTSTSSRDPPSLALSADLGLIRCASSLGWYRKRTLYLLCELDPCLGHQSATENYVSEKLADDGAITV